MKKKKVLIVTIIMLFTTILMLAMSNKVLAVDLSKIEVTVPAPTIGKTLAKVSDVTVKSDGSEKFEVFKVEWMKYDHSTGEYKDVTDFSKRVEPDEKYLVTVHYKRPDKYGITNSTKVTLNGKARSMSNPEEFNNYGGEKDYCYDGVGYYFEKSQVQKNLSKIEVSVPTPTTGKKLAKVSDVTVVADGEKFEVFKVEWMEYDYSSNEYKDVTDLNKEIGQAEKYIVTVHYKRPDKYGITNSTKVTLNGKARSMSNPEEFNNYGGEKDYCYDGVGYYFEATEVVEDSNDSAAQDKEQENNNQQTTKPSTTKPSTTKPSATTKPSTTTKPSNKEEVKDETVNNEKVDNETVENEIVMPDNNIIDTNNQTNISNETIGAITTEKGNENIIEVKYILYIVSGVLGIALAFIVYKVFIYSKEEK